MTSSDIRASFLAFFEARGHRIVPSAPVIPHGDPTLLFTNAGMNQFKDVFLGTGKRDYTRASDAQKCIRVSGKHNDLEEVGYDTYHHTLFEMLGNWSFGDYFKTEAIAWSWELLTDVWKLPKERLHATVYRTDDESFEIWKQYLPESHIHRFDEKDNFWEMGDTGPCGPCTEIHFDRTPDLSGGPLVNAGVPEVIEVWNNVFIQYNRLPDGSLEDLPAKHVDTGMGFERITAVIQGKDSNYDTDVFQPIIRMTEQLSGRRYHTALDNTDGVAMRVIADHIRTLSFAIADGAIPGNEGRGYVLRRILRRAARYARNLGMTEPVLWKHVGVLCETMGTQYPEIVQQRAIIERVIRAEEESFLATLERGLARFDMIAETTSEISGADAFELYDTFGFPIDLTQLIARERGMKVDLNEYERLLDEQRARSRAARKSHVQTVEAASIDAVSQFTGYSDTETTSAVLHLKENQVVLASTPCYVEMGGQVSDTGSMTVGGVTYAIDDVRKVGGAIIHIMDRDVDAAVGDKAIVRLDVPRRRDIEREHTATHILHEALRRVLGTHVQQSGSLVAPEYLRFDFSHFERLRDDELAAIEQMVNEKIFEAIDVYTEDMTIEKARTVPNVKMFFGDKYGDRVRVVTVDPSFSVEFCGGTHVRNTSQIGMFKILSESSVASGVRRIEAIAGRSLPAYIGRLLAQADEARDERDKVAERVRHLEKQLSALKTDDLKNAIPAMIDAAVTLDGVRVATGKVSVDDMDQLKSLGDELRSALKQGGIGLLAAVVDDKVQLVCVVTDDLTSRFKAGSLVGAAAKRVGGGGGGKPHLATAGGKDVAALDALLSEFPTMINS
jgi:alanyl-tRNA synthetase